jgi:hypothetical protein
MTPDPNEDADAEQRDALRRQRLWQERVQTRTPPGDLPEPPEDEHLSYDERMIR